MLSFSPAALSKPTCKLLYDATNEIFGLAHKNRFIKAIVWDYYYKCTLYEEIHCA